MINPQQRRLFPAPDASKFYREAAPRNVKLEVKLIPCRYSMVIEFVSLFCSTAAALVLRRDCKLRIGAQVWPGFIAAAARRFDSQLAHFRR
jgi:hypothetical protein